MERARPALVPLGIVVALAAALILIPIAPAFAAAPFANSLLLDGVDDHARINDNDSLDLGDTAGEDFTLEAFVYVPDETSEAVQVIFYKQNAYRLSVNFNTATDDVLIFGVWSAPVGSGDELLISTPLTTGWHHIAAVFDNDFSMTNDRLSIFLDGAMVADNSGAADYSPGIYNATNTLSVGANFGVVPWDGWIDEARISDTVRYSGAYMVPGTPFTSDMQTRALWHFDDAECSTSFVDSSVNGNTLTGMNGAQTAVFDATTPTLHFTQADYVTSEGAGTATITVTRSGDPNAVVGVDYSTSDGTATAGEDYTTASATLSFTCGEMQDSFEVPITSDVDEEGDETVNLSLSAATGGAVLGAQSTAVLTISDAVQLRFDDATYFVAEDGVTATITVERIGDPTPAVGVNYLAVPGTATSGSDFSATMGNLPFASGEITKTFNVTILDDPTFEGDETVDLSLSNPTGGAVLGTPSTALLTIIDDDQPLLKFSDTGYDVDEPEGPGVITVLREGDPDVAVSVNYLAVTGTGTATSGVDFEATMGLLAFASGEVSKTFNVTILDDDELEPAETLDLSLSNPTGGAGLGSPTAANLTILDDDQPELSFSAVNYNATEGGGSVTVTVQRGGDPDIPVGVDYATSNGTAVVGSDYDAASDTLAFLSGETSKTFDVTITDDDLYEPDETVNLALSSPSGGAVLGVPSTATITISDNDPSSILFEDAVYSFGEQTGGGEILLTRVGGTGGEAFATFGVVGGTATSGIDFSFPSMNVTFEPGEVSKTVAVNVGNDETMEGPETIVLQLTSVTGADTGAPDTTTITIGPSDQRPDGWISTKSASRYIGNNIYNTTGAGQTKKARVKRGSSKSFYARIYNDGSVANAFKVTGTRSPKGAKVTYFVGATNITKKMLSAAGYNVSLASHKFKLIKVKIAVTRRAKVGSAKAAKVTARWSGDSVRTDVVKAVAKVIR